MGKGRMGGQRPVDPCWTQRLGCFTRAFPAHQAPQRIQTLSHVAARIDTAYSMLKEGGSNLLCCSCQKPLLVYAIKAPERQNIPKTTLLKLVTPETPSSPQVVYGWQGGKQQKQKQREKPSLSLQCAGPGESLYDFSCLLLPQHMLRVILVFHLQM